jgi:hypothetical protein
LHLYTEVGDRAGLATTLNNIGRVYAGLGDGQQALDGEALHSFAHAQRLCSQLSPSS